MELRHLLTERRAVSPVIAVTLLIAVTVVLVAVVASFALGLGAGEPPPQLNLDFDWDGTQLTIIHSGGDSVEASSVSVLVDGVGADSDDYWPDAMITTGDYWTSDPSTFGPGSVDAGDEVRVVWRGDEGQSVTLGVYDVPP